MSLNRSKFLPERLSSCLIFLLSAGCSLSGSVSPTQFDVDVKNATHASLDQETETKSKAMHHYLMGQLSYVHEDFKSAMDNFSKASELSKGSEPELHSRLAELYVRSGDLNKALSESEKALEPNPEDAHQLLLRAGILESLGRDAEAEPIYRKVIDKSPTMTDAYVLLASLYIKANQAEKSIALLEKLSKLAPDDPVGLYYLSRAYEAKGNLTKAAEILSAAREKNKQSSDMAMDLVRLYIKTKKLELAKKVCEEVLIQDPQHQLARRVMGQLMIGEDKLDEALKHLQVLESIEEDSSDTRFKVALIQIQRQNFKEAISELNLVLAKNPDHDQARYYLASVYAASGRKKEALEELFKVKPDKEMFVKSRMFAAFLARQENDPRTAEKAMREAFKHDPESKPIISYFVLVLRENNKLEEAEKVLSEALQHDEKNDRLMFQRAIVLHDLGRIDEATALMQKIIELNPKNSDALNYVAYDLVEKGTDLKKAKELVERALEIKPNDGYYLDTLGWLYFKTEDFSQAEAILNQAYNASEEDIVISEHYADCLARLEKTEKAIEVYTQALKKGEKASALEDKAALKRIQEKVDLLIKKSPGISKLPNTQNPKS